MMKKGLIIVTMVIMLIGVHSIAQAVYFGLELSDGVNVVTVYDDLAGDINLDYGVITFSGSVGAWIVNVTTGITYEVLGSQVDPHILLGSINVSSSNVSTSGSVTLKIDAMALNFTPPGPGALDLEAGGTTSGTVLINEYYNAGSPIKFNTGAHLPLEGNVLFGWLGPFGPGAFDAAGRFLPVFDDDAPYYALTLEGVITHRAGVSSSSFSAETQGTQVPEPGIMILLGISMMSLAGLKRYWKD